MITAGQAVTWLNWERTSRLSPDSLSMLREIANPGNSEERKQFLLDEIENCSRDSIDLLERAEILVYCSKEWLQRSCLEKARQFSQDAVRIYESKEGKDQHRQAVAAWILHLILSQQFEYISAFSNARAARENFQKLAELNRSRGDGERMGWYYERINEMTFDLTAFPEEAYEWITKFHGSHLSGAAQDIQRSIRANIQRKDFPMATQQMDDLYQITRKAIEIRETSEAFAFCGLAAAQMGNIHQGIYLLKKAKSTGSQASHEYACIQWMIGLIQTRLPGESSKGIANLETGVRLFTQLRENADHGNQPDVRKWYDIQMVAMKKVLQEMAGSAMRSGANLVA